MAALDQAVTWGFGNDSIHECPFLPWHVTAVPSVVPILIPSTPHQCLCLQKNHTGTQFNSNFSVHLLLRLTFRIQKISYSN